VPLSLSLSLSFFLCAHANGRCTQANMCAWDSQENTIGYPVIAADASVVVQHLLI